MLNRYLFRPPFLQASLKRGSWVLGVHEATTTLLRSCSWIAAEMASRQSWAHAYWDSSARTTWGRVFAYSVTAGTSTTDPMLIPQWQTQTPTLGSLPSTSFSAG